MMQTHAKTQPTSDPSGWMSWSSACPELDRAVVEIDDRASDFDREVRKHALIYRIETVVMVLFLVAIAAGVVASCLIRPLSVCFVLVAISTLACYVLGGLLIYWLTQRRRRHWRRARFLFNEIESMRRRIQRLAQHERALWALMLAQRIGSS